MPAYPTGSEVTVTVADVALPEYWEAVALRGRYANSVLAKPEVVTFKMSKGKKFGDNYNFTETSVLSTNAVSADGAVANQSLTHTQRQVALSLWREVTITVPDRTQIQSVLDYGEEFSFNAGKAMGVYEDDSIADDHGSYTGTNAIGDVADPGAMSDDLALEAVVILDNNNIPAEDRTWAFSPRAKADLLKMDKFTLANATGFSKGVQLTGEFGDLYGNRVLTTSRIVATGTPSVRKNLYLHKEACALVMERSLNVEVLARVGKATTWSADILFGEAVIRTTHGVTINTKA